MEDIKQLMTSQNQVSWIISGCWGQLLTTNIRASLRESGKILNSGKWHESEWVRIDKKSSLYLTLQVAQIRYETIGSPVVCTVHTALKNICACCLKVAWKKIGGLASFSSLSFMYPSALMTNDKNSPHLNLSIDSNHGWSNMDSARITESKC